jgi:arylsulfatase A-like enzyme
MSGARFELAYAPMSVTAPTHASLFTGLYPITHRVIKNGLALSSDHRTLAEILTGLGYDSAAFVSSYVLDEKFGLGQGFEHYADDFEASTAKIGMLKQWENERVGGAFDRRGNATTDLALRWLGDVRRPDRPFFLFVHYFDPHAPYAPPAAFAGWFADPRSREDPVNASIARYDAEIAFVDHEIGRLVDGIDRSGVTDTIVILTADHGEGLMDHRYMTHGVHLFEEEVRVPLVIRWPGEIAAGLVYRDPVVLIDLFPTILEWVGAEVPDGLPGLSLAPILRGQSPGLSDRPVFLHRRPYPDAVVDGELHVRGEKFSIRVGRWKYIVGDEVGTRELYDLASDPGETIDRYYRAPEVARDLSQRLDAWRARHMVDREATGPGEGDREGLEALGYLQ